MVAPSVVSSAVGPNSSTTSGGGVPLPTYAQQQAMARIKRIQQLQKPVPTSMPLTAAMQLLLDHYENNNNTQDSSSSSTIQKGSVYLMDPKYLQNWFVWAWYQNVPKTEEARTKEALRMAATQLGLAVPSSDSSIGRKSQQQPNNSNSGDFTNPGPIDSTALSVEGHPLLLDPLVKVAATATTASSSSFSKQQKSTGVSRGGPARIHSAGILVEKAQAYQHHNNNNDNNNSNNPAASSSSGFSSMDSSEHSVNSWQQKECVAVPESFYETLRQVHGVLCDDGYTISFQPPPSTDMERLVLQHYQFHHSAAANTSLNNSPTPPRPIEFRRKVIRQLDTERLKSMQQQQKEGINNLMEKLLLEEQQQSGKLPTILAVEVSPIKLIYSIQSSNEGKNGNKIKKPKQQNQQQLGFVLVSSATTAVDALMAVMRVAEPSKSSESVRIWSRWNYEQPIPSNNSNNHNMNMIIRNDDNSMNSSKMSATRHPTKLGDGFELVDLDRLAGKNYVQNNGMTPLKGGIDSPASVTSMEEDRMTVGEWVLLHHSAPSSSSSNHRKRELELIVETKKTVHSAWARDSLCLHNRLQPGDLVDAQDVAGKWYEAVVRHVDKDSVTVHYAGWASRWDAKIPKQARNRQRKQPSKLLGVQQQQQQQQSTAGATATATAGALSSSGAAPTNGFSSASKAGGNSLNAVSPSGTASVDGVPSKVKPPAPLWSQSTRWREQIQVGDLVEVRDSSSLVERPKWYRGVVKKVGHPHDPVRELFGGADLEEYSVFHDDDTITTGADSSKKITNGGNDSSVADSRTSANATKDNTETEESDDDETANTTKTMPLLVLRRTQQILVEVEQEKSDKASVVSNFVKSTMAGYDGENLTPQPPHLRWVNLYGEEICKMGTHLRGPVKNIAPVTLRYEYESHRKPVEIMKQSHPMHGSGFMRESLRGVPPAPGSVGLHNLGNSCFLNSTVQCLNHIKPLTQYFIDDKFNKDLNKDNPLGSGGNVAVAFASLLKKIWAGNHSVLVPRLLKQTVANFAPQFDNSYQHDSHEFCQFLMDGIHEDLNRVKKKPYVEELEGFGMEDDKAAIESWRKHLLRHDSIIVDHCQGMHRSHLTCPQCGRESIKFDVYSSISLPLPVEKNAVSINLEDCIEKFMEAEQLDERDAYYCPSCRRPVCALKLIALWSVPDIFILILHVRLFTFDTCMTSGHMLRSKIDHTVN